MMNDCIDKKENYFHPENASKFYKEKANNTSKHVIWLKFADKHIPILLVLLTILYKMFLHYFKYDTKHESIFK